MIKRHVLAATAGLLAIGTLPAGAQGLVDLHEKVRVGSKLCMATHFHHGNSNGHKSRKEAESAAIGSWQGFTAWEYGAAWGRFSMAESRSVKCDSGSGGWSCEVQARPCRRR
jgi:hypothetical protein